MPKFFVNTEQIQVKEIKIIGEDVKHISNVLRMKKGEEINICDRQTNINYLAEISNIDKNSITCNIIDYIKSFVESSIKITIFQGLPKADKMEYIIQKSTELGVEKIVPVSMSRSIVKIDNKSESKKLERWQKIAETAAKQSGRDYIPTVKQIIKTSTICEQVKDYDLVLLAYENEEKVTLKQELKKINIKPDDTLKIGIIIGPEGGIDDNEVQELISAGAKPVTLGKRILRTETASITIISNIMYEYEM